MTAPEIVRSEPDLSDSLYAFRERLAETVSWCKRRVALGNLGESLRSAPLAPPPATPWLETVRAVGQARLHLLGRSWRRSLDPLGGGLLLLYFPSLPHSGETRAPSDNYFDERDTPPWDTWLAFMEENTRSYLVSWVAPEALGNVTSALKEADAALRWLDGSGVWLEARLRS